MKNTHVPIPGSQSIDAGRLIAYPKSSAKIQFTLFVLRKELDEEKQHIIDNLLYAHPSERSYLGHAEVKELVGADPIDFEVVRSYLEQNKIVISNESIEERFIDGHCDVGVFESVFQTTVGIYSGVNGMQHMDHSGLLYAPRSVSSVIASVVGLSKEPQKAQRRPTKPQAGDARDSWNEGYSIPALGKAYNFPDEVNGSSQCIGIIELGGTYKPADFKKYCKQIDIKPPKVSVVGAFPSSGSEAANSEVTLDMQVVAALAPKAEIVLYYAHTFVEALRLVVNDKENSPSVVSISWAAIENFYHHLERIEFDNLLLEAALQGITIMAASGDHGAYNNMTTPEVSMPAAHPYVLGVGGTVATLKDDVLTGEVVWNEFGGRQSSGGGFSVQYQMPSYQETNVAGIYGPIRGRGVPDVAANASDINGYQVIFENKKRVIGGTSASTPLWASLFALINEELGYRLGFANAILYHLAGTEAFNAVVEGNNQVYNAGPDWNPCTGLGSPNGNQLLELIKSQEEWVKQQKEDSSNEN